MSRKHVLLGLLVWVLVLAACGPEPTPTATSSPTVPPQPSATFTSQPSPAPAPSVAQEGILISEMLPGISGVNNNLEFVELYNAGTQMVDLNGWSLWYRVADGKEEELVYAWDRRADVPGRGHYLLARAGEDIGNFADAHFDLSLFEKKGGLALRDPGGQTVDSLVWGDGPADYLIGSAASAPEGGGSLERLPGGDAGNGMQTGDNGTDFVPAPTPSPQNSGDTITPLPDERLVIRLDVPQSVEPGGELACKVEVQNLTGRPIHDVRAWLPSPPGFEMLSLPSGASQEEGWLVWSLSELADGATETGMFILQSPYTYLTTLVRGTHVEAADWETRAYGPLLYVAVEGGSIPIGAARALKGATVSVEGIATMYTDGFYAGADGTKFYMEDETGGIQVYCPGARGQVEVSVGDHVRVSGKIEVYRNSMEIIPATYPDDVEVIEAGASEPQPASETLAAASVDEEVLGRLIVVEGTAVRIEEFTYSYEVDLMDDEGNTLLVYVDKETGVTTEPMDVGNPYRVAGISEVYDAQWQIKPRFQTDLVEIFPPELMLELRARNSVLPGETITYTLTVYNHTHAPLTHVRLEAIPPTEGVSLAEVLDGGEREGDLVVWTIPELAGGGASVAVRYTVTVDETVGAQILVEGAAASAAEWLDPVVTDPQLTFVGGGVPIWAIQGPGTKSPYVRDRATTEGIVIGVFPELQGFWIQELETDDDPATSAGLFVLTGELEVLVGLGDRVRVRGDVRELSGQTLLHLLAPEDLMVLSSGNELPAAVELDPPLDEEEARVYFEPLEGMLVQVSGPAVAVAPTSKYGETALVRAEWEIERVMQGDPTGMLIFVDDGSDTTHYDLTTLPFALQTGDTASGIVGPLTFKYEAYEIEPLTMPDITPVTRPLPALESAASSSFGIATFNVEDLFDYFAPHPSDPPLPTRRQYELDLTKAAEAVLAMGAPTIVGLQEVENLGVLVDLVGREAIAEYGYQPFLVEGTDSRGIDVGYLVRSDRATVEGAAAYPAPEGLTSRPPLLITVTVHLESGNETVYVLNNHFTSMSGGEEPTEPRRKAQAAWNVTLAERILAERPQAHVVVLGDLNSFYESPPMDVLRQADLRHVYEFTEPYRPYTYIFRGVSETLDHIWVTPSLYEHLVRVEALRINADYPPPIPDDPSARRGSDHDPLVAVFSFE
jgi:predicted extracellular nuclease